jgi:hypothetical protein
MTSDPHGASSAAHTVALTTRLSQWLALAGIKDDSRTFAVGLADSIAAFGHIAQSLEAMLHTDPRIPAQADEALRHAGAIAAHYFGEAKGHMLELEASWDLLEVALAERGMHDDEVDTQ